MPPNSLQAELPLRALVRTLCFMVTAVLVHGCSSAGQLASWRVLPSSACSSFVVSFPLQRDKLQSIVGPNFIPSKSMDDRFGTLQITVHDCSASIVSDKTEANSAFAVVAIPLAKEKAPFSIAGLDTDEWASLVLYVGPSSATLWRLMRNSAFAVMEGEITLTRHPEVGRGRITADIGFGNGRLNITAALACEEAPFRRTRVLVGTGSERFPLLFGEVEGHQCDTSDVDVRLTGDTPFSDLGLTANGAIASIATEMFWSYRILRDTQF